MCRYSFLTKPELLGSLACLVTALASSSSILLGLLTIFTHALAFYLTAEQERGLWLRTMFAIWIFIILGTLPLLFTRQSTGVFGWGVSANSLSLTLMVGLRAVASFGAVRLLLALIPIYELCRGLRSVGVPAFLMDLIELSYRYIYMLLGSAEQIRLSQLGRAGYTGNLSARYADASLLISRSFVLAHSGADQLYDGLISRGFEEEGRATSTAHLRVEGDTSVTMLRLRNVSYAYIKDTDALRDITLAIGRGERIALLGENGAGKSTLMRLTSGLLADYQGSIELEGRELPYSKANARELRQRIALVFQNSNHQLFCPTVEDELAFGLRNRGLDDERVTAIVELWLERYELIPLRHKAPHQLSEGQKKWVALVAVLITEPDIILLDEPTAALDRYYTNRVLSLLNRLSQEGKTIILSTHDMQLVDRWAQRALVMHAGKLLADLATSELWAQADILEQANIEPPIVAAPNPNTVDKLIATSGSPYRLLLAHTAQQRAYIVGAGIGAQRKLKTLLEAGVLCTVLAPEVMLQGFASYVNKGILHWDRGLWHQGSELPLDIHIVVAATGIRQIDNHIVELARQRGLLYTSLSDTDLGNIQFVAQGGCGVRIGVHTQYQLPELSQAIRDRVLYQLEELPEQTLEKLSSLRQEWLNERTDELKKKYHEAINRALTEGKKEI